MKKKILFLVMSLSIMMLAWGCGKKNNDVELDSTPEGTATVAPTGTVSEPDTTTDEAVVEAPIKEAYEVGDYITLGEYKGLTLSYTKLEVSDADIDAAIQSELQGNATEEEVTDRAVQTGDVVNIDYEGLKDGVAFEGGTAQAYDLTIGAGNFIQGFEEGLIGAKVGDELALDLTFPADYSAPELAGQAVVFNVKVNSIKVSVVPELTEDYVKTNTDYENLAAYKEGTRTNLIAANDETMRNEKIKNLITTIVDTSTISSYPQSVVDYYAFEMESYYSQYAAMFGYELVDFLAANNLTEESFALEKKAYAEDRTAQELVLNSIIKAEKMEISDDEYKAGVASYIEDYGYASEEEFFQNATEEQIRESLIWEKAVNFILDQAVEA
ncbi:MAG: trigger factor [Herbinix sp.]|jgi:trigger factor|nr:trigger factor [Herbinix sp.]